MSYPVASAVLSSNELCALQLFREIQESMKKIDFQAKKTEAEWLRTLDDFWMKATPKWFEWLEWLLILGAIQFLAKQTQNTVLRVVSATSYAALFFYLQSFFFSLEFYGFPLTKSERVRRLLSLVLSGILAIALGLLFAKLVSQIEGKT